MTFNQGIDFRQSSGYVTDPANCYGEISTTANYPTTPTAGSSTGVGWETSGVVTRDRDSADDPRLAGVHAYPNGSTGTYRIDLPAAGTYVITLAIGDAGTNWSGETVELFDGATSLGKIVNAATINDQNFYDASGNEWSAAAWPGSNVTISKVFATTILRLTLTNTVAGNYTTLAHVFVTGSGGGPDLFHIPSSHLDPGRVDE